MENNEVRFTSFARRRTTLNEQLERQRIELDKWFERNASTKVDMRELANLEALLQERRNLLAQLIALDDDFVTFLVSLRSKA